MDINQLLRDLAIIASMLLMALLAIGPLWLSHQARAPRAGLHPRSGRRASQMGVSLRL